MDAEEVIQAYIEYPNLERMPIKELKYFKKITVKKGASINHRIVIPVNELQKWDLNKNQWILYPGRYKLVIGAHAKDEQITTLFEVQ